MSKTNKYLLFQSFCGSGIQEGLQGNGSGFRLSVKRSFLGLTARIHFQADSCDCWQIVDPNGLSNWGFQFLTGWWGPLHVAVDGVITCFSQCKISREGGPLDDTPKPVCNLTLEVTSHHFSIYLLHSYQQVQLTL